MGWPFRTSYGSRELEGEACEVWAVYPEAISVEPLALSCL